MKLNHIASQATLCVVLVSFALLYVTTSGAQETQAVTAPPPQPAQTTTPTTKCDPVFTEVTVAVSADPDKVLLVVEEHTLASPDCVCEIIKAASLASKADADLTRQIMLTALNVAPEKAKNIEICIAELTAERSAVKRSGKGVVDVRYAGKEVEDVTYSGKGVADVSFSGKDVQPLAYAEPPTIAANQDLDYYHVPSDIRGVYLIQPAGGGIAFTPPESDPEKPRPNPPTKPVPLSPSRFSLTR